MRIHRYVTRAWYYFRLGYSTYLTFLLGFASTLVTVYYLAIRNVPSLLSIFPSFTIFGVLATIIGVPLSVAIGWAHLKRSMAYESEQDIVVEASPYYYKMLPGYWKEAFTPTYLEILLLSRRLLEAQNLLTSEDKTRIEDLEKKLRTLMEGGLVGKPRSNLS
jgi:hypothetical protein